MKALPRILVVVLLAAAVAGVLALKSRSTAPEPAAGAAEAVVSPEPAQAAQETPVPEAPVAAPAPPEGLPRLVELGADKCVPCKMMAPILEELKTEYAGKMDVQFIDVWKNPRAGEEYGIQLIPTQIFFDGSGKELFRHTGFFPKEDILAAWKELGFDFGTAPDKEPAFSRWAPAQPDTRPRDAVCYLCDGDIDARTRTVMSTPAGDVGFCSPHCYVITFASLTDEAKSHQNAAVTDWTAGTRVPVMEAVYLYGMDENGRPEVKAFAGRNAAEAERARSGGNVFSWEQFEAKETAARCGFCDRPVYPEDASVVRVDGMQTWGCCVMCALGVAARTGKDIHMTARDALAGEPITVTTLEGHVAKLEPPSAVAWAGARKDPEGKIVSTGCFKQGFFASEANLRKWVEAHPAATGHQVTIEQALVAKMKLTPEQISKACKIGECAPR